MNSKILIVSDVDNTLIFDDQPSGLSIFNDFINDNRKNIILVYSSGRTEKSIRKTLEDNPLLPSPDYIVGGVGTEIYLFEPRIEDKKFKSMLKIDWQEENIQKIMNSLPVTLQPKQFQSIFKKSYFASPSINPEMITKIILAENNILAQVIYSSDRDLDVIPTNAGKGNATKYIQQKEMIDKNNVIVTGDSLNDKSMFELGYKGIIIGNASNALKNMKSEDNYLSIKSGIEGVLEGLLYWKPFQNVVNIQMVNGGK